MCRRIGVSIVAVASVVAGLTNAIAQHDDKPTVGEPLRTVINGYELSSSNQLLVAAGEKKLILPVPVPRPQREPLQARR